MDQRAIYRGGEIPVESNLSLDEQFDSFVDDMLGNRLVSCTLYYKGQPELQMAYVSTAGGPMVGAWEFDWNGLPGSGLYVGSVGPEKFKELATKWFNRITARPDITDFQFRTL